jgi:23S rRNA-/tRNA-specific pseudouridylate synthase
MIDAKLLRIENAKNEAKVRVDSSGQSAVTHYQILQITIKNSNYFSLIECRLETGRMHQIRVHLASIGCPVLSDRAYGNIQINSYIRREYGISRQLLHAYSLEFIHPKTGKNLRIEAPYPEDFQGFVSIF